MLLPARTRALQHAFQSAYQATLADWFAITLPNTNQVLNARSEAFFRRTREASFGKRLEELAPAGSELRAKRMVQVKAGFDKVDGWLRESGGPWVEGEELTYADITIASWVKWFSLVVPEEWGVMATWHGGRWAALLESVEKYAAVV